MSIINYILRKVIAKSKFPLFHVSNMLFFIESPHEKKFEKFKNDIVENEFFSDTQKDIYIELFMKAQKHYHALCLFKKIWRESKYSFFDQETDLCFNPLSQFPEHHKVTLLHFNKKYIFRLTDFMNIWITALTKRSLFTPQPRLPINPFINKPFRKHHLLKVYLKLQETKFQIPFLIQKFYTFHFNLAVFEVEMYPVLREMNIENYMKDEPPITMFLDIIHMVETLREDVEGTPIIEAYLPEENYKDVVKKLKPMLRSYFYSIISCNPIKKDYFLRKVVDDLKDFFHRYPDFGTAEYYDVEIEEELTERNALSPISPLNRV